MLLKLIDNNSPVSFFINLFVLAVMSVVFVFTTMIPFNNFFVLNVLSIAASVFLLNVMSDKFHLFKELTYLSSFIFLLFTTNVFPYFSTTLIGVFLLLFISYIYLVLSIYNQSDVKNLTFNAGFILGLLYTADKYILLFGAALFLMLMLSRSFYWREWLLAGTGIALPVFYIQLFGYLKIPIPLLREIALPDTFSFTEATLFIIISAIILFILTLFYTGRKTVRKRNIYTTLLALVVIGVLAFFVFDKIWAAYFLLPVIAILATHLYHQLKRPVFRWLVLLFCLGISVINFFVR